MSAARRLLGSIAPFVILVGASACNDVMVAQTGLVPTVHLSDLQARNEALDVLRQVGVALSDRRHVAGDDVPSGEGAGAAPISEDAHDGGSRYGIKGPANCPDPHIARQAALRDAAKLGMIGLLSSGAGDSLPIARNDSLGTDPLSARGSLWGDAIVADSGASGLGLRGTGPGGGGTGEGIGLGSIGTIGHGAGTGSGQGFGSGHGRLGRSDRARPPRIRTSRVSVVGSLPSEVVKRIVRRQFGRFRLCYERGLRRDDRLKGRVTVELTIGADGTVSRVKNIPKSRKNRRGTTLKDRAVVSCIERAFYGMSFPRPENGKVKVRYSLKLKPPKKAKAKKSPKSKILTTVKPAKKANTEDKPAEPEQAGKDK